MLNPLRYFSASDLEKISPYAVFTGEGYLATIAVPHECDCEYCDVDYDEEKRFFRTKAELDKETKRIEKDLDGDEELISIETVFYARVVRQDYSGILKEGEK